jgi:ATP-dependent exoDNAse (exonuclease V) beta subunit
MNREELIEKFKVFDDPKFLFNEEEHRYTYDGEHFLSVTQTLSNFHKPFNSDYWSKKKAFDRGISQLEILSEWKEKNDYANIVGTATHLHIEKFFLREWYDLPTNQDIIKRINKFNVIYAERLHKLTPFMFEKKIFSKKWKLAGTIDALFFKDDDLYILDWKTNKAFHTDVDTAGCMEKMLKPFNKMYKNHLNEYSIQLSTYKAILKQYDIIVKDLFLVYIPPEDLPAKIYKATDLCHIIEPYFDENYESFKLVH